MFVHFGTRNPHYSVGVEKWTDYNSHRSLTEKLVAYRRLLRPTMAEPLGNKPRHRQSSI
jgi:hypothetical protein